MSARFIAGALGLVFLFLAIAGMPDIGDTLDLFSAGGGLNAVHLLIGVVLSMAAFSAGRARPQVVIAAVVYGVVALLGLNRAVSTIWPDLFGADGRWMAAILALVLALGAMVAREQETPRTLELQEPASAHQSEQAEPNARADDAETTGSVPAVGHVKKSA